MEAFRSVRRLPNPCAAGSSWSYASTSTISPPTPSTSSSAPISSGATSCGLRLRFKGPPAVVVAKGGECERRHHTRDHAQHSTGDDRESQRRERREHARLDVPEARGARHLRELDPLQPAEQVRRRRSYQHRAAKHGAEEIRT